MGQDETKNTNQNSLSEKGQAPVGDNGSTSQNTAKTLTEDAAQKLVSDALAKAGRSAKALEDREKVLTDRQKELDQWKADREKEEEDKVKGDPDKLTLLQQKKALRDKEAQLQKEREQIAKDKAEMEEDRKLAANYRRTNVLNEVIAGYEGIDQTKFSTFCEKYNLSTKEQIEDAAGTFGKKKEANPADPTKQTFTADPGSTSGGSNAMNEIKFGANAPSASDMIKAGLKKK